MSASLYRWMPRCDGHYCPGDCDGCPEEGNEMSHDEIMNDLQYPQKEQKRDLVEVVRCANCKYWDSYPSFSALPDYHRCRMYSRLSTRAIDYCSRGERRDDAR